MKIKKIVYLLMLLSVLFSYGTAYATAETINLLDYSDIEHYFFDQAYNYEYEDDNVYLTHYIDEIHVAYASDGSASIAAAVYTSQYSKDIRGFQEKYEIIDLESFEKNTFFIENPETHIFIINEDVQIVRFYQDTFTYEEDEYYNVYDYSSSFEIKHADTIYYFDNETVSIGVDNNRSCIYVDVLKVEYKTREGKSIIAYDYPDALNLKSIKDSISAEEEQKTSFGNGSSGFSSIETKITILVIIGSLIVLSLIVFFLIKIFKHFKEEDINE